MMKLNTVQ